MAIEESTDRASEMMVSLIQSLTSTNIVTPDQLAQVSGFFFRYRKCTGRLCNRSLLLTTYLSGCEENFRYQSNHKHLYIYRPHTFSRMYVILFTGEGGGVTF